MPKTVAVGDRLMTKKQHPCGTNEWIVTRTGCDIKLKCAACGRVVMLGREDFERSFKKYISRAERSENI